MTTKQYRNISAVISIALPLIGFLLILAGLNLYQYYRVKNNVAAANLAEISNLELVELQSFFTDVPGRLNVTREWGENGLLQLNETVELNKKFFPLINSQSYFTGMLLADSSGTEYYLYRSETGFMTRTSKAEKNTTRQTWQRWLKPDQVTEGWEEESDYDPRKRPWFVSPGDENKISWTQTYTFFQSGKPGVTASISWIDPDSPEKYMVFGLDLLIEDIQKLLSKQQVKRKGIPFLVNPDAGYFIEGSLDSSSDFVEFNKSAEQKKIIELAIDTWKDEGKPTEQSITFTLDKQKWLAQFRQFSSEMNPIWVGVAASEKDMAAALQKLLFKVEITDLMIAVAGGLLMLFLIWRLGWRRSGQPRKQKIHSDRLRQLIVEGEGALIEFKASVRYNIKTDKPGKEIELAWLKAVTAFLNSEGGTLLLGVADDGTVIGIAHDNFENDDRCLLHVKNLLNQHIGAEFSRLLHVSLISHDDCQVVAVECESSHDPVFLRVGKNEDFFIRSGPSNTKLSPSQIISYLEKNRS